MKTPIFVKKIVSVAGPFLNSPSDWIYLFIYVFNFKIFFDVDHL